MYHRILPESDARYGMEEPGMVVTPENFAAHLEILSQYFELVSLGEWLTRAANGKSLPGKSCAITFDDGWQDNYEYAFPILRDAEVPATLFAVAEMVGTNRVFWPNRVANLLLHHASGVPELQQAEWLAQLLPDKASNLSREDIATVIHSCKSQSDDELDSKLDAIESALGITHQSAAMVDWQQLREMRDSGLVEIGSHTCTHRRLLQHLPYDVAHREIVHSKGILEDNLERPVNLFCYPNGNFSPAALKLVQENYLAAVTTRRGLNSAKTPFHQLYRVGIHNDASSSRTSFLARLSGWPI